MYLIDTNVISEIRKQDAADSGVRDFFRQAREQQWPLFLSVITVGELRRGVEAIRHRGDIPQASQLEHWLNQLVSGYSDAIIGVDYAVAQVWGRLRVPHHENALDKLIAATALIHDLTVATRNVGDFQLPGLSVHNPFTGG